MENITAYLANQFGFSETGRYLLDTLIIPGIEEIGIRVLNPFTECGKELDVGAVESLKGKPEYIEAWERFSLKVTPINNALMRESDCLLALLDGGPAVDDGVASEIGYYSGIERGPIFALRSDFRKGENPAVSINPQILGYIIGSKGKLIDGPDAIENWFDAIKRWYDSFREFH